MNNTDKVNTHYCYILVDNVRKNYTYNGYTNNVSRRIRQHNGEIVGGAKFTSRSQWSYFVIIQSDDFDYRTALSFEWHIKYPNNKRPRPREFNGVNGRLKGLCLVLKNKKFDHLSSINIYIRDDIYDLFVSLMNENEIDQERLSISSLESFIQY